jgi:hypothetical protein
MIISNARLVTVESTKGHGEADRRQRMNEKTADKELWT